MDCLSNFQTSFYHPNWFLVWKLEFGTLHQCIDSLASFQIKQKHPEHFTNPRFSNKIPEAATRSLKLILDWKCFEEFDIDFLITFQFNFIIDNSIKNVLLNVWLI